MGYGRRQATRGPVQGSPQRGGVGILDRWQVCRPGRGGEFQGETPLVLVDVASGKKRWQSPGHKLGVTAVLFHPDGKHLLSSGRDTTVRIWQVADGKLVKTLGQPRGGQFNDWLHEIALSPDGKWLAAADMAGFVHVWRLSSD